MKDNLKELFSDNLIKICLFLSVVFMLVQTLLVIIFYYKFPPLIPFLNSRPWGEERLVPSGLILLIPAASLIVFFLNNFLASVFYRKNTLVSRILVFNCLLLIFLGLMSYIQIIFLVF